jgi:ElaB/YqjD/DUF883 family membrane-anchored ribosome-binding protein
MSTSQKVMSELRGLAADTEELIEQVADQSSHSIVAARDKAREAITRARAELSDLAHTGAVRARAAGDAADHYVHDNPWRIIAGAAILGLIAGALIARR